MVLALSVRFDIVDAKNKASFTKVRIPTGFTISQYSEFVLAMGQLLANINNGKITRASFCVGLDISGATIKAVASGLSDIAQKAFFGFSTAVAGLRTRLKIPAVSETKVVVGSDVLDQSDPDVAAFISAMENGIVVTAGTISPSDDRENDITTTDFARELFRKK